MEHDMEQFNKAVKANINRININFWKEHQKNFSDEAMEIYNRAINGEKLTELDHFILITEDQQKVDQYKKFYNIKEDIKNNNLSQEGLDFLVDTMCGEDKQNATLLKQKFSSFVKQEDKQK